MSEKRVWATNEDGSLEYVSITKELLQPSMEAMQRSFYVHENICMAFDLPHQPEAFPEMDALLLRAAQDGVSVAAIEKATGKVVGAAFNKLEDPEQADFYPEYVRACKHSASKNITQWMCDTENMFDIYKHCKVCYLMEIMFLGILPEFRRRGIAKKLFEVSIEIGQSLKLGKNVKEPIDGTHLGLGKRPELITGIFTSFVTQRIARELKFSVGIEIGFDKFTYDGNPLSARIERSTPYLTYEYFRL